MAASAEPFAWRSFDLGDWRLALTSPGRRRVEARAAGEIARAFHALPPAGGLALFENVCSVAEGVLIASGGAIVKESLAGTEAKARFGPFRRDSDGALGLRIWPLTPTPVLKGDHIFLRQTGDSDYGVWLLEVLPRVAIAAQFCDLSQFKIVVSRSRGGMAQVVRDSLGLFGIRPEQIVALGERLAFFQRLVFPLPVGQSPQTIEVLESFPARLAGSSDAPARIFVTSDQKRPVNEGEILDLLRPLGFRPINPGRMSFAEQVRAFSRAEWIVGVSGAGLANVVFAPRGVRVFAMSRPGADDASIRGLTELKDGSFSVLHGGTEVDLAGFKALLEEFTR